MTINVSSPSYCDFRSVYNQKFTVNFRKSGTGESFLNYYSSSKKFYLDKLYIGPSIFSVNLNGQTYYISTDYFYRDYRKYDPDEPPLYD